MKHLLYSLLILSLFSCSKDQPEKHNTPPRAFEVTAKVEGTDVILTWTEAVDADGDAVTYAVVYGDTLAKGLTARTHTIKNLPYETEISGTVVASDGKGGKTEQVFKVKTSEDPYVLIPDTAFEQYLIDFRIDDNLDGRLLKSRALLVKDFYIHILNNNIKSLEGIEAFRNLEKFEIWDNIPIKKNTLDGLVGLRKLQINLYDLEEGEINLMNNSLLDTLIIEDRGKKLKKLDLSKNLNLRNLVLRYSRFSKLNIDNNLNLISISLERTGVSILDLSNNTKLENLYLFTNELSELSLCNNFNLHVLTCQEENVDVIYIPESVKPNENWKKYPNTIYKVCD